MLDGAAAASRSRPCQNWIAAEQYHPLRLKHRPSVYAMPPPLGSGGPPGSNGRLPQVLRLSKSTISASARNWMNVIFVVTANPPSSGGLSTNPTDPILRPSFGD